MGLNELLQIIGVAIALAICIGWILRRIRQRDTGGCGHSAGSCSGCGLKDHCNNAPRQ